MVKKGAGGVVDARAMELFEPPTFQRRPVRVRRIKSPIWTAHKARLIERYLLYFVYVTKHGTYIDGFAGPQQPEKPEMWAAKLVVESRPRWLRRLFLFDESEAQVERLEELLLSQPKRERGEPKREVEIIQGDFNAEVKRLLERHCIPEKEASFCLLDQRTFECHWSTVEALAGYKGAGGMKIELFYFLPQGWLDRALKAMKDEVRLERWWGRSDWSELRKMRGFDRAERFCERFRALGYLDVKAWPIYEGPSGDRTMYYMIHATDHPAAPVLMRRAYERAVEPPEAQEQIAFEFASAMKSSEASRQRGRGRVCGEGATS